MSTSYFDPKLVIAAYGTLPILGFADGTVIEASFQGDGARAYVGTQKNAVIIQDNDDSAEVTMRILNAGPGRNTLSALLALFNAGNLPLPLTIKSISNGNNLASGLAVMKKKPDFSFGSEDPIVSVVFVCGDLDVVITPGP